MEKKGFAVEEPAVALKAFDRSLPEVELRFRASIPRDANKPISTPAHAAQVLAPLLDGRTQESFVVLALDNRHRSIAWCEAARGSGNVVHISLRDVFAPALQLSATAIIVAHNHPSGDPDPSPEDRALTKRLISAGELLGIPVLDHLIIGCGRFFSHSDGRVAPFRALGQGRVTRR